MPSQDNLMEGWQQVDIENGVPYFVNHKTKRTQWDHPVFVKTIEDLAEHDNIKYAAYRTAMKIKSLQAEYALDYVDLRLIGTVLAQHGLEYAPADTRIPARKLRELLCALVRASRKPVALLCGARDLRLAGDSLFNLVLNIFDMERSGGVRLGALKTLLTTLSSSRLSDKYKYYFQQCCDESNHLSRKNMASLLHDLIQLPKLLKEAHSFGGDSALAAVQSCFSQSWSESGEGLTQDAWLRWLLQEPQTLVWLPTLHRIHAAQAVEHDVRCAVCKAHPLQGLRYKCLKCFSYDLCQVCFFTGRTSKSHKLKHPTQEYCFSTSTKEDTKAFMRTLRNNISKKHRNKHKPRYLPITGQGQPFQPEQQSPLEAWGNENASRSPPPLTGRSTSEDGPQRGSTQARASRASSTLSQDGGGADARGFDSRERRELASIIQRLEYENSYLMQQLSVLYERSLLATPPADQSAHSSRHPRDSPRSRDSAVSASPRSSSAGSDSDSGWAERDKLDARQEILEAHNSELNRQLGRLRALLNKKDTDTDDTPPQRLPLLPLSQNARIQGKCEDPHDTQRNSPAKQAQRTRTRSHNSSNMHSSNAADDVSYKSAQHEMSAVDRGTILRGSYIPPHVPRIQLSKLSGTSEPDDSSVYRSQHNKSNTPQRTPIQHKTGQQLNVQDGTPSETSHHPTTPFNSDFSTPDSFVHYSTKHIRQSSAFEKSQFSDFNTPESVELTFGCIDNTLGRTHFTIASPEDSRDFAREEREMAELVAQLDMQLLGDAGEEQNAVAPPTPSRAELLRATEEISRAFAQMTSSAGSPRDATRDTTRGTTRDLSPLSMHQPMPRKDKITLIWRNADGAVDY